MEFGFSTWKDLLEVVGVPVAVALAALIWPSVQLHVRRRAFERLIFRELREVSPHPTTFKNGASWVDHQKRDFVHKRIFLDASTNRDFILSLPADVVYHVSQLWMARERGDAAQWLYSLGELASAKYDRSGEIAEAHRAWAAIILIYEKLRDPTYRGL
jgi:hypothetical protein